VEEHVLFENSAEENIWTEISEEVTGNWRQQASLKLQKPDYTAPSSLLPP
jgi:hypothetical protein